MTARPFANAPCCLYRHYDHAGTLLYVGITTDPIRRWGAHTQTSKWACMVAWIELVWFDSPTAAARAETRAINAERPIFNLRRRKSRSREVEERRAFYMAISSAHISRADDGRLRFSLDVARLAAGEAAQKLGTLRRVPCRIAPGATCVACGPDREELYA